MKKIISIVLLSSALNSFAQKSYELKDLFTEQKVIWYGIDYSHTQFVGTFADKELNEYFKGWNRLVIEEPYRYDISRSLQKDSVIYDIQSVESINEVTVPDINTLSNKPLLVKADLTKMVSNYESKQSQGLGLVFIAESYNKQKNEGTHYAVVFDIFSKKILISQKFTAPPAGMGLRNFWASTILSSTHLLAHNYRKWKKKYGQKSGKV